MDIDGSDLFKANPWLIMRMNRLMESNRRVAALPSLDVWVQYARNCLPSAEAIKEDFSVFGTVMYVHLLVEKHCTFVHFSTLEEAKKAVEGGLRGQITNINYRDRPPEPQINIASNSTISVGFYQDKKFYCKSSAMIRGGQLFNRKKEGDVRLCLGELIYTFRRWQVEKIIPNEDETELLVVWSYRTGPLISSAFQNEQRTLKNPLNMIDDCNAMIISIESGQRVVGVLKKLLHPTVRWSIVDLRKHVPLTRIPTHSLEIELLLESLISQKIPKALITEEFYAVINNEDPELIKWALRVLVSKSDPTDSLATDPTENNSISSIIGNRNRSLELITDPAAALKEAIKHVQEGNLKQSLENHYKLIDSDSNEYMRTYMLEVTPTKMFLTGPSIDQSNRVLRKYKDHAYHFIRVTFRDDDGTKLNLNTELQDFVKEKMLNGIKLGGLTFTFLAYANSELRHHSCYFMAPFVYNGDLMTTSELISRLGTFKDKTVAKQASRIGQCFSSTVGGFAVTFPVVMDDDIHPENELGQPIVKYNFSDGIGRISRDLAEMLAKSSCADQIRYGGCKGMIVIDETLTGPNNCGDKYYALHIRPSMKKFEANPADNELEINGIAQYLPAYLNRQMITLLLARGVSVDALRVLRDKMMNELIELAENNLPEKKLHELLDKHATGFGSNVLKHAAYKFKDDLFIQNMLSLQCYKAVQLVREKTRIRVEQGAHLYGVLDEHGYLKENQIFVRLRDESLRPSLQQILGKAFVTRSPSLHPGDIRMVECVDVPQLHHLENVIVFPRKGKRPLTDMISGGDLDGDLYTVIWDKTLFPTRDFEPMDFTKPAVQEEIITYPSSHVNFFVKYMATDALGKIANAWLSWAEIEPNGAASPKCIRLAQLFSLAVDYPKTGGDPIAMPDDLVPDQCPDFLENRFKQMFHSKTFIGETYRYCKEKLRYFQQTKIKTLRVDRNIVDYPGSDEWMNEAETSFEEYKFRINDLMRLYKVTEVEAFSGVILASDKFSKHRQDSSELNIRFLEIRSDLLKQFKDNTLEQDQLAKAAAWYKVAYRVKKRLPSFAWLVYDRRQINTTFGVRIPFFDRALNIPLEENCVEANLTLLRGDYSINPEKRITERSGDVYLLSEDILDVLKQEDQKSMTNFNIISKGSCHCSKPKYEFDQELFVMPLVTYSKSGNNTGVNQLISEWQATKDDCPHCMVSRSDVLLANANDRTERSPIKAMFIQIAPFWTVITYIASRSHQLPPCLLFLVDDNSFKPSLYESITIANHDKQERNYELAAFTIHHGIFGGHETCVAKRKGAWYSFDDSRYAKFDALDTRQNVRLLLYIEKAQEVAIPMQKKNESSEDESWLVKNKKTLTAVALAVLLPVVGFGLWYIAS